MNLYLIGYMGSGKSSIGKRLANRLEARFVDMDTEIEEYANASIPEIFAQSGEETFRALESRVLDKLLGEKGLVVATGGGAACHSGNLDKMLQNGLVVYLELNAFKIARRLKNAKTIRPLVEGKEGQELETYIKEHLATRIPYYEQADLTIDADKVKAFVLDDICSAFRQRQDEAQETQTK